MSKVIKRSWDEVQCGERERERKLREQFKKEMESKERVALKPIEF